MSIPIASFILLFTDITFRGKLAVNERNPRSDDGDQLNRELFAYMEQKGFKFKLNLGNKTSGLAYINYQTKGVLSWLIKPLINKKIASYQDAKSLR